MALRVPTKNFHRGLSVPQRTKIDSIPI